MSEPWHRFGTIDDASIRHVLDTVRRWESIDAVEAIDTRRSPGNVKPDEPWRVSGSIPLGRVSTVVAQANASGMNLAIERGFKESRQGETVIRSPRGVIRLDTTAILMDSVSGAEWVLGGANLGQGNDPNATSWYDDVGGENWFFGTEYYGTNYGSSSIIDLVDVTCLRMKGGSLRGDGTDPAAYGIRMGKGSVAGSGPSMGTVLFEQVAIHNCDVGMNAGRVTTSGGGYNATNCSEVLALQPMFFNCPVGYETMHGQAVNHVLIQPQHHEGTAAMAQITGGGNVLLLQPNTYNSAALFKVVGGGSGTGTLMAINSRLDGTTYQTKLWNATDDEFNVGVFFGGCATYDAGTPTGARVTMRDNHFVSIYHWHNLSDGTSKPVFETSESGAKTAFVQQTFLETVSAGAIDRDRLWGTIHSGTEWRTVACIDGSSSRYTFTEDIEYPRRNGRCSTHRFRTEDDFTHNGDGMRSFAVSASGAGAGSDIVFPWSVQNVGILSLNTGTTNTGSSCCITDVKAMAITGGPWFMEVLSRLIVLSAPLGGDPDPTSVGATYTSTTTGGTVTGVTADASDADEQFTVRVGFCDSATGNGNNAIMFRYTDTVNSGKWQAVTRDGGTETAEDTGITADQTAILFEIRINAAGTEVKFYINGTLTNTISTNLPDATDYMGLMPGQIVKSTGTNNRSFHIDFAYYNMVPSSARATGFNK